MKKTVGVVIATYNGEKYIEEQLKSILNQNILPDFIVISDGNSNDNTIEVCETTLKEFKNYRILKSDKKLSVKENFQKGLENCNTDYIFFSDQDDVWKENKIEDYLKVFKKFEPIMIFSNATIVDENLNKVNKTLWEKIGFNIKEKELQVYEKNDQNFSTELIKHNVVTGMNIAISSQIKAEILPFSDNSIHDVWLAFNAIYLGRIVAINNEYVLYRQHKNNVVGVSNSLKKTFDHKEFYLDKVENRFKFIMDVINKFNLPKEDNNYKEYIDFLDGRILFMKNTKNIFFPIKNINKYFKYEYKPMQIFIKDYYIFFMNKLRRKS